MAAKRRRGPSGWIYQRDETCAGCGSVYRLSSMHVPMRDQDKEDCSVCGRTFIEWNGGTMWSAELVTKGTSGTSG